MGNVDTRGREPGGIDVICSGLSGLGYGDHWRDYATFVAFAVPLATLRLRIRGRSATSLWE